MATGYAIIDVLGSSPYTYRFNSGPVQPATGTFASGTPIILTGLSAGDYRITVTTDCGRETLRFTIGNDKNELNATFIATHVKEYCDDYTELGSIKIIAVSNNSPFKYTLDDGISWEEFVGPDTLIKNLPEGTYFIKVMDDADCEFTLNAIEITKEKVSPVTIGTIHVDAHPICGNNAGTITLYLEGGSGGYEYQLYKNTQPVGTWKAYTDTVIIASGAGTYTIVARDTNYRDCAEAVSTNVTLYNQYNNLRVNVVATDAPGCTGTDKGRLYIDVSGGLEPYTYYVNGEEITPPPTGGYIERPAGKYIIEVSDYYD
jgi:hypothetical protein